MQVHLGLISLLLSYLTFLAQIINVVLAKMTQLQHARHAKMHPFRIMAHVNVKHQVIFGVISNKVVFLVTINARNVNSLQITAFPVPLQHQIIAQLMINVNASLFSLKMKQQKHVNVPQTSIEP